jgi:predicted Kef-type K+ transport protein
MRLGTLIIGLVTLAVPSGALSQQPRGSPVVGVMLAQPIPNPLMDGFRQQLRELGYVEGRRRPYARR